MSIKPPKITMQQSQGARGGKKSSGVSPIRGEKNLEGTWSGDTAGVIGSIKTFEASVSRLVNTVQSKREVVDELLRHYNDQLNNNLLKFISTHDNELVKKFYLETVLTPTEIAQIAAKV